MAWQIESALTLPSGRAGKGSHATIKRMGMDGGSKVGPSSSPISFVLLCSLYCCSILFYYVLFRSDLFYSDLLCQRPYMPSPVQSCDKVSFLLFHTYAFPLPHSFSPPPLSILSIISSFISPLSSHPSLPSHPSLASHYLSQSLSNSLPHPIPLSHSLPLSMSLSLLPQASPTLMAAT